jgi:RNA polymerase sigma-70 factor (ECF subfamily)
MPDELSTSPSGNHEFSTTEWSVVLDLMHADPQRAQAALHKLCSRYWYPLYAFVRQKGHPVHEAEDLTQGFFHFILSRNTFQAADRSKGRFRTFLLTSLVNFLHNERDKATALKRGGAHEIISLDEAVAETTYSLEPADNGTPDKAFERRWAAVLVERVLDQLRTEHEQRGKAALFSALRPLLTGEPVAADYDGVSQQLGMEQGTVKVVLHRARRRFGELLRREVAHTVARPEDVEPEIRQLLAAIAQ